MTLNVTQMLYEHFCWLEIKIESLTDFFMQQSGQPMECICVNMTSESSRVIGSVS